ncbi:binding-protein-dependent transport systems inner membrane component [Cellulomonas flavigena DSM 20109]|uniref:Binding-protein-dependent transport systems inner membrane component n=1 Tax=Cellulomonas flavigena (strain ATCC 482 / DSM 20109 / BCRC 11376 / JCM 18109 / NBRC 3775 / NCIMB 8073 / NRS 134) TaxID=446466 RepID=D5UHY9_CELFN|nr:carbohydrate ABC transporter permease [Cellulomonas flavigena]ADG73413.1 binding-protein-dependent transport systems inner membrane component [Cellulomonas flavigena DSM 20109]
MHETRAFRTFRAAVVAVLATVTALPLYVMVTSALKPLSDVRGAFSWWPSSLTFQPFVDMWTTVPLARYFVNSLVVASAATAASLVIAVFASYAVSRYRFRGRSAFTTTVLSTQMFPGVLFLLPLFIIFVNIEQGTGFQFIGTRIGLVITYLTFSLPFSIWMLSGYLDNIPQELDEAARVDGCSPVGALLRVVLPAARPGVIAVAIYAFMTAWGEVLFASVMTTEANRTLAVGIRQYSTQTNVYWNEIMAASLVVSIPVVIGFLLLQRHFVAGLTAGAVK